MKNRIVEYLGVAIIVSFGLYWLGTSVSEFSTNLTTRVQSVLVEGVK